ncbi:hypothetical protein TRAPUB_12849 [Trametes pubescens]|uniref:F-box domain-containing protein n=1 Tax=Trametes pubescens TaxID=154538 RepID=A0A1M2VSP0_TRAPU|nr:hypothetical protein TRAPUB_12849 [Trametes pubescens]
MSKVDWPMLQTLTLEGFFPTDADHWPAELLLSMFCRMPALRRLVITAALTHYTATRCCMLGSKPCAVTALQRLRSITIAYPNPNDRVFSIPFPDLTHLALRDWPRHYDIVAHKYYNRTFRSPILSATEALSILRRLQAPVLATLELVYFADEADDDLLAFIANAFPKLQHLQLHRYRSSSDETVDHRRIARTLSAAQSLVSLRLNLDFQGDPGEHNPDLQVSRDVLKAWCSQLSTFGWEILSALELCASLKGVALLYRGELPGMWAWYSRSRQATQECVYDRAPERRCAGSLPSLWALTDSLVIVTRFSRPAILMGHE